MSNLLHIHFFPGRHRFKALKASYIAGGLIPRQHGNARRLPHNPLTFETLTNVVSFLQNYAEHNAILLPGHILGYKLDDIQLFPI